MPLGHEIVRVVRTIPLGSGMRSVWYLPDGSSVHAIEDNPIETGTYFLRPDDTGRFRNWVIECSLGSRIAVPARGDSPARTDVEVHLGNRLRNTEGCFCPGMTTKDYGVFNSRTALKLMREVLLRDEPAPPTWALEIR